MEEIAELTRELERLQIEQNNITLRQNNILIRIREIIEHQSSSDQTISEESYEATPHRKKKATMPNCIYTQATKDLSLKPHVGTEFSMEQHQNSCDSQVETVFKSGDRVSFPATAKTSAGLGIVVKVTNVNLVIKRLSSRGRAGKGEIGESITRLIKNCEKA